MMKGKTNTYKPTFLVENKMIWTSSYQLCLGERLFYSQDKTLHSDPDQKHAIPCTLISMFV